MNKEKANNKVDVLIVGAGVAGLYMLYKLRGMGFTTSVIEKSDELLKALVSLTAFGVEISPANVALESLSSLKT